ncbi:MAG TPA: hypothetical protein VN752_08660 [Solirubrobacterales bacterium]|nr:hypothetical protein [Solirubrobacterales bacterium]
MASLKSEQGPEVRPAVDPIGALDSLVGSLAGAAHRAGEERVAYVALTLSFALAAALILAWGQGQTFVNDEWSYLVSRGGWSLETLLTPQNGHLIVAPLLVYKGLFATVGADSHLPFQVTTVVMHLTVASLFFVLVRARLPLAVAVALAALVAFFGAGWDTIMGAYELPNLTGMAAGLGMLVALERRTVVGDLVAALLLGLSLASFSVGIAFALGALLAIWLGGREQWRRAWPMLVPVAVYAIWFLWARKFGQSEVTAEGISSLFSGMADQLAGICAAITGLFRAPGSAELPDLINVRSEWGYPLAVILAGLVVLHVGRSVRSIRFWTVAAILLAYLALVAIGLSPARAPSASRYVYMGGILTLLLVAELARDIRWRTPAGLAAAVLFGLSLMANVAELRVGGRLFEAEGATNRATLATLELSRDRVDPNLAVEDSSTTHSHPDMLFPAWAYFQASDDFGSPAFSIEQLETTGPQAREAADQELVRALALSPRPAAGPAIGRSGSPLELLTVSGGHARPVGACLALVPAPGTTGSLQFELPPGGFSYRAAAGAPVEVTLGRFADVPAAELPAIAAPAEVAIPRDASPVPWRAELQAEAKTLACPG